MIHEFFKNQLQLYMYYKMTYFCYKEYRLPGSPSKQHVLEVERHCIQQSLECGNHLQ
jgi:hypothetical protein